MSTEKKSAAGSVIMYLFCAPFCIGGLVCLYLGLVKFSDPSANMEETLVAFSLGLVFSGAGFGLLYAHAKGGKRVAHEDQQKTLHPEEPWQWREDWARCRSKSNIRNTAIFTWIFAGIWNLISWPIAFAGPTVDLDEPATLMVVFFPAVGLALLYWAVVSTLRWRRYGKTWLEFDRVPVVIGRELTGWIKTRFSSQPSQGVRLKLTCVRRTVTGRGKNRSTHEAILWREERTVPAAEVMLAPGQASVPVRFHIPADVEPATAIHSNDTGVLWVLGVEAKLPGVDYRDEFDLPVYRTADSPSPESMASEDPAPATAVTAREFSPTELESAGILMKPGPQGMAWHFSAGRNKKAALATTFFTLIWTGIVWALLQSDAPALFPIFFGLFDVLLIWAVCDMWFGTATVMIGSGVIAYRKSLLGMGSVNKTPFANIKALDLHIGMQSGGRSGTPYYDIKMILVNNKRRTLAGAIRDKRMAEWILAEWQEAMGKTASG